jgi:Mg2+ and Co2+ transporter CorA
MNQSEINEETIPYDDRPLPTEEDIAELKTSMNELAMFMEGVNSDELTKTIFQEVLSDQERATAKAEVAEVMGDQPKIDNIEGLKKQLVLFETQIKEMRRMIKKRMADAGVPPSVKKEMKAKFNREQEQINRGVVMLRRMIYRLKTSEQNMAKIQRNNQRKAATQQ